jgi:hypothetical protein
LEYKMSPYVG